jgi:hypothetical protein
MKNTGSLCGRFILFHDKKHSSGLGAGEVEAFLTDLAVRGKVRASTQNQTKSAIPRQYMGST